MARKKETKAATKTIRTSNSTDFGIDFWAQYESMSANAFIDVACAHYCDHLAKKHSIPWRAQIAGNIRETNNAPSLNGRKD